MRIIIIGPKGSGKSSVTDLLTQIIGLKALDIDNMIESSYKQQHNADLTCRQIYQEHGEKYFRNLEMLAAEEASKSDWCIINTGGSTLLNPHSRKLLRENSILVYLDASADVLWERMRKIGLPPFYCGDNGRQIFNDRLELHKDILLPYSDIIIDSTNFTVQQTAQTIAAELESELAIRSNNANTLGDIVRLTTFGESHGAAIGAVLDGIKPGLELSEADIQIELDRRRPGQSAITTSRMEEDRVHILSGVFEGKTTGASIGMVIYNKDQDSSKYDNLKSIFRPGHADFTFFKKYGIRDHRGGGRSSGRETAARVAGGSIAKKILKEDGISIVAYALEIAGIRAKNINLSEIENNSARCPDVEVAKAMEAAIINAKKDGDSVGGIVELRINGIPAGLGDPVFAKLDAMLAKALFSLGAVKGVEIGLGFEVSKLRGSESNDPMKDGKFVSNNAGGILGGISNGNEIIVKIAIKPTPSISREQQTINIDGQNQSIKIEGRHDPCIIPRVIPVVEAMAAMVILDAQEIQNRIKT